MVERAKKPLRGSTGNAEAEVLRKVSRSVRGEEERVDESEVRKLRKRLDDFFLHLQNPSSQLINPVKGLREIIGCSQIEMAAITYYSLSRWASIEAGGIAVLPNTFLKIATELFGTAAAGVFDAAWNRYRASLSDEARRAVERRLFPVGGSGAMCP